MSTPDQKKYNRLAGKRVLIIGGTSGIGFAVAEASIEAGAIVTVSSSQNSSIESALSRLSKAYPSGSKELRGFTCDLGTEDAEQNIEKLFEQTGKVDHIVVTAGDPLAIIPLQDHNLESLRKAGQIRFFGPLLIAKVGSRYLSPGPTSSIVLTTGSVSLKPNPNWSAIAAYASGLHGMTRNLALDLKPIRVNLVSPGALDTELWKGMSQEAKAKFYKSVEDRVPTGRIGLADDVAECYLWLMKDQNVTGAVVQSDSGSMLI